MTDFWLMSAPFVLGILAIIGAVIYRAGVRRGCGAALRSSTRAFDQGVYVGRRQERQETTEHS